jgi:hypothetical protein
LTERPLFLVPFTYIGVIGVVVLLVMLYTMILMTIFGRENTASDSSHLIPWILGGIIVTFFHFGVFDLGRFMLTGSWEGFHINIG